MSNRLNFRDKLIDSIFILLVGVMGGILAFYALNVISFRGTTPVIEKVTEKQVYLEASSNIDALKLFTAGLINVFPKEQYEKFATKNPDLARECFEKGLLCKNIAVVLSSDGLILYGGEWQEKQGKDLLAMDQEKLFYELEFKGKIKGFSLFRLVKKGELLLNPDQRTKFYNLKAVLIGNLKLSQVGQKVLAVESVIFGSSKVEEGILSEKLNLALETIDLREVLSPVLVKFSMQETEGAKFFVNLAGQLMMAKANDRSELTAEEISALMDRLTMDEKSLSVMNLGLRCLVLDKTLAQTLRLEVDYGCLVAEGVSSQGQIIEGGVIRGSLSERAGLKSGDIILEVGNRSLLKDNFMDLVMRKANGGELELTVLRGKKTIKISFPL